MIRQSLFFLLALTLCCSSVRARQATPDPARVPLLTSVLGSAVEAQSPGQRDLSIRALRYLEDEALKPFFGQLATRRDPLLRAHGIFGLAEYESPQRVNTHMIAKVESASEQAALIGEAIRLGYLGGDGIREILRWSAISPIVEVMLIATLGDDMEGMEGMASDEIRAQLDRLANAESPRVSMFADILLLNLDQSSERVTRVLDRLGAMDEIERLASLAIVLALIRDNELDGTGVLLRAVYGAFPDDQRIRHDVLGTYVLVDPADAGAMWRTEFEGTDSLATKIRLAFHALAATELFDESFFEGLDTRENALLASVLGVARANAEGVFDEQRLLAMIDSGHRAAAFWVIERAADMPGERAVPLLRHIVDRAVAREDFQNPVSPAFIEAAAGLALREPEQLLDPLNAAISARDSSAVEGILAALLREAVRVPWSNATEPAWKSDRTKALSALFHAKLDERWLEDASNLDTLERVALGYGKLPHIFRVQASWRALKARGEGRRVLAQLMASAGTSGGTSGGGNE